MDLALIGMETTHTPLHVIVMRLIIGAGLGALIGMERGGKGGTAGLRTHMLIALAATLFTLLGFEIAHTAVGAGSQNADPVRAIEAVTSGIAFLGAGAIFQQRGSIQGLTTGAGMWLAGAVGVATALGYYLVALLAALLAVLVLVVMRRFSHRVVAGKDGSAEE